MVNVFVVRESKDRVVVSIVQEVTNERIVVNAWHVLMSQAEFNRFVFQVQVLGDAEGRAR